jgi:hypothetical protein
MFLIQGKAKGPFVDGYIIPLLMVYTSVIWLKAIKEVVHFSLNNLIIWFLDVIAAIGRFCKHVWALNFVYRKKD